MLHTIKSHMFFLLLNQLLSSLIKNNLSKIPFCCFLFFQTLFTNSSGEWGNSSLSSHFLAPSSHIHTHTHPYNTHISLTTHTHTPSPYTYKHTSSSHKHTYPHYPHTLIKHTLSPQTHIGIHPTHTHTLPVPQLSFS